MTSVPSEGALRARPATASAFPGGTYADVGAPASAPVRWIALALGLQTGIEPLDAYEPKSGLGWGPMLAVWASLCVGIAAIAANGSRSGDPFAVPLFYGAVALLLLPLCTRAIYPSVSRSERICLVMLAAIALFAFRFIRAPVAFIDHDEFLHWVTTNDILEKGRLFTPNSLLPVSALYPGLEIVVSALSTLSGLTVFASAALMLFAARLVFVAVLYLAYEKMSGSSRVGAIGCLIYMGCTTFYVFDAHFSYESLAIVFVAVVWLLDILAADRPDLQWRLFFVATLPTLLALSFTHHMSAFYAAVILATVALFARFGKGAGWQPRLLITAATAILLPLAWSNLMGNPTSGYLGPVIADGAREVARLVSPSTSRRLFVSDDGTVAPAWERAIALASVGLVCLGLSTGLLRVLRRVGKGKAVPSAEFPPTERRLANVHMLVFALLTFGFPISIIFRLTRAGWEIGNRIGTFSFFGVGLVVAVAVASLWQGVSRNIARAAALGAAGTMIVVGGMISGEGPLILVPAKFRVSADAASVEPMGVSAARWARDWLGDGNMFASDRINRLLLATYGRQSVATTLQDSRDTSEAILAERLGPAEIDILKQVGVEFLLIDLRLTTALPVEGVYFDGAIKDRSYRIPPAPKVLLKFNNESEVSRLFDNGYSLIYDVRKLSASR